MLLSIASYIQTKPLLKSNNLHQIIINSTFSTYKTSLKELKKKSLPRNHFNFSLSTLSLLQSHCNEWNLMISTYRLKNLIFETPCSIHDNFFQIFIYSRFLVFLWFFVGFFLGISMAVYNNLLFSLNQHVLDC